MFKQDEYVTAIGSFIVKTVGDEYIELDPFGKGDLDITNKYTENGFIELNKEGTEKEFDGFTVGDFFKLNGKYKVIRSNEIFSKIQCGEYMLSLPNHKLMGVK